MSSISVQNLLDEVEAIIAEEYPDNPEAVEEGVSVAENFLYGTLTVDGLADSTEVTADDYARFAESICNDSVTTEFYYGSAAEEDLFFEVRDILDEILQDEFQGFNSSTYTRWGQCPSVGENQNVSALPYFFGSNPVPSGDVFGNSSRPTVQTEETPLKDKKPKPARSLAPPPTSAASTPTASTSQPALVRTTSTQTLSGRAYCDVLAQDIQPGGANLIVVGAGFSCEYNYNPNRRDPVVAIGFHGEEVTPSVYRYYPRTPNSARPASTAVATPTAQIPATSSVTTPPASIAAPVAKPKSLDDLFRMYESGASEKDIERVMQYKGDVPWDVDDPDGINGD